MAKNLALNEPGDEDDDHKGSCDVPEIGPGGKQLKDRLVHGRHHRSASYSIPSVARPRTIPVSARDGVLRTSAAGEAIRAHAMLAVPLALAAATVGGPVA